MTCTQCSRPALYFVGDGDQAVPLCLTCWATLEDIHFRKWLQASAMANQAMDEIDSIVPIGPPTGRIPVVEIARVASRSRTYHNIQITNSNVGVVNTGHLARIDAAITISSDTEAEEVGARLKDLTDAIVNDSALNNQLKQQMIEVIRAISDQVVSKSPSNVVTTTLFDRLVELASSTASIAGAVEKLRDAWTRLQNLFSGS